MQKIPFFSIIIPYRNRELLRIQNCLRSLEEQKFQDFEIIFVDYGTEKPFQKEVEKLINNFSKAQYIYADSRGMFWNRSQALNIGLFYAKGDIMVISDVDLVFENTFLAQVQNFMKKEEILIYPCINLGEAYKDFTFEKLFQNLAKIKKEWYYGGGGNIIFHKKLLEKVGGYNEYYRIWGYEDIDFVKRIKKADLEVPKIPEGIIVLHQFHQDIQLPKGWKKLGFSKLKSNQAIPLGMNKRPTFQIEKRPALKVFLESKPKKSMIELDFPKEYHYALFTKYLMNLQKSDFLYFRQDFENPIQKGKSWRLLLKWINQLLEKMKISYRIVDLKNFYDEPILSEIIHSFLFYLILENIHFEEWDYYYHYQNDKIEVVFYKR